MCGLCGITYSIVKVTVCSAFVVAVVLAFVAGGYLLGPVVVDNDTDETTAPTVYEYYKSGGVTEGLVAGKGDFTLNKKVISLYTGSIHYFRVHPAYWRDRLRKLRAAGFVAVETYVPWNLHEPYEGVFDFGDAGEDMSPFLDIEMFLKIAQEEDLLAIVRPGPYICGEWEFGGLPSWLLKDPSIRIRTSDSKYMSKVEKYFSKLLPILKNLQFTSGQGPIIGFQVENEYGNTKEVGQETDKNYLEKIKKLFEDAGLKELYFTSDTPSKGRDYGAIPGVLQTANFNVKATEELKILKDLQPDKMAMVMEFWTGWFDHWGEYHHGMTRTDFRTVLEDILRFPSGVNYYMFHGGTTFGFLSGGNVYNTTYPYYLPDISSYDYDAPLSEAGDYTIKYFDTIELLAKYQKVKLMIPDRPVETKKAVYGPLSSPDYINWDNLLAQVENTDIREMKQPVYMEMLDVNQGSGQNYGYIVYRKENQLLQTQSKLQIRGKVQGVAMVVVDNELKSPPLNDIDDFRKFGYWCTEEANNLLPLNLQSVSTSKVDIIVENWSRVNYGKLSDFNQFRGLTSSQIEIDGVVVENFKIYPLQFKKKWVNGLKNWQRAPSNVMGPVMLRYTLEISEPTDTFLDMQGWGKGIAFVNGFNLGRYSNIGPVRTLFAPAPLFNKGSNEIIVFEHFKPSSELKFSKEMIYKDSAKTFNVDL